MTFIKHRSRFAENSQAFLLLMHAAFLTKVSTGGPHPSRSSILRHSVLIYIFLFFPFTNCAAHYNYQQWHRGENGKKEGERIKRRVNASRTPGDTPSCFAVVVSFYFVVLFFPFDGFCAPPWIEQAGGKIKSLFCYWNTETWPWVSKASEQNRMVME